MDKSALKVTVGTMTGSYAAGIFAASTLPFWAITAGVITAIGIITGVGAGSAYLADKIYTSLKNHTLALTLIFLIK